MKKCKVCKIKKETKKGKHPKDTIWGYSKDKIKLDESGHLQYVK